VLISIYIFNWRGDQKQDLVGTVCTFPLQNEIAMDEVTPTRVHPSGSTQQVTLQSDPAYMDLKEARPTNPKQPSLSQRADYAPLNPRTRSWEVARNQVTIEKIIGKGAFGQVAKGTAVDLLGRPGKTTVAIKMLKSKTFSFISFEPLFRNGLQIPTLKELLTPFYICWFYLYDMVT